MIAGLVNLHMRLAASEREYFRRHPRTELPTTVGVLGFLALGATVLCWAVV